MALEKELTKQDETIQGIFSETQSQQQAITLLQNENRSLRKELVKINDERVNFLFYFNSALNSIYVLTT